MEIFGRLKSAFREYRHLREVHQPAAPVEHAIVFYAGWLGHYVADGSQPLHTTIHCNGWAGPNPKGYTTKHGIHAKFESTYVAQNITAKDFAKFVHTPERLANPFADYINYLRDSNRQVENVYAIEKAGGFNGKVPLKLLTSRPTDWQPALRCCWIFGTPPGLITRSARSLRRARLGLSAPSSHGICLRYDES